MLNSNPIRVLIVDDHAMVRKGLIGFLRAFEDLELAGEATSGEEAIRICSEASPDVVLMDLVMPGMKGPDATRAIRARCPEVQVLALTSYKERDYIQEALDAGAVGYLLKNVSVEQLAEAIRAAYAGQRTLAPEIQRALDQADRLERLATAILQAPPELDSLVNLLQANVPRLLPDATVHIRVFPDQVLLAHPVGSQSPPAAAWEWIRRRLRALTFAPGDSVPWATSAPAADTQAVAPIMDVAGAAAMGAIWASQTDEPGLESDLLPLVRSLAAQIGSSLHSIEASSTARAQEQLTRELALAGEIQASFLPDVLPVVPGWEFAATLRPAKETSGDFYDFVALGGKHLGVVIADVADKGMGAALYMALCRSLLRTFAAQYFAQPERVFASVNDRMLADTRAGLFVSAFLGILDLEGGELRYSNAGHNPPYVIRQGNSPATPLIRTGMVLGVSPNESWGAESVLLEAGDLLLLHTDGVTDALDADRASFGEERLLRTLERTSPTSAHGLRDSILLQVDSFVGDAPQFDDITLVTLMREPRVG